MKIFLSCSRKQVRGPPSLSQECLWVFFFTFSPNYQPLSHVRLQMSQAVGSQEYVFSPIAGSRDLWTNQCDPEQKSHMLSL